MAHILVLRFSALGDVAMTVPPLRLLLAQYPHDRVTMVTRRGFAPLFQGLSPNLCVHEVDLSRYKGLCGLFRLSSELLALRPDLVADLHDVLRTKVIRWRLRLTGLPVNHIDKGRRQKHRLTRPLLRRRTLLKHTVRRYMDVFLSLDRPLRPLSLPSMPLPPYTSALRALAGDKGVDRWVGIAPFARHKGKVYPPELMREALALLAGGKDVRVFLFGGGEKEKALCRAWAGEKDNVTSVVGELTFAEELALISRLDVMLSMDSANQHLAALFSTPTVTVWGATHPAAGFSAWGSDAERWVQLDLPCRPCSIYGNKPCRHKDYACLTHIPPAAVAAKVKDVLEKSTHE